MIFDLFFLIFFQKISDQICLPSSRFYWFCRIVFKLKLQNTKKSQNLLIFGIFYCDCDHYKKLWNCAWFGHLLLCLPRNHSAACQGAQFHNYSTSRRDWDLIFLIRIRFSERWSDLRSSFFVYDLDLIWNHLVYDLAHLCYEWLHFRKEVVQHYYF